MTQRTLDDWKNLIEKQIASGLSVPKFCKQHNLSAKYFYGRKSQLKQTLETTGFIQATVTKQSTTVFSKEQVPSFLLKTSHVELSLPSNTSAQFLSELLNGLSS